MMASIENLISNQTEIYEALKKLLINFKKESYDRKTIDYCNRKLELAQQYWSEYQNNHRQICEYAEFDHVYFIEHHFDKGEELYLTIENLITGTIEKLSSKQLNMSVDQVTKPSPRQNIPGEGAISCPGPSTHIQSLNQMKNTNSSGVFSKLDELIKKQNINFKAFMRTVKLIELEHLQNKWEFEDALKNLHTRWSAIDSVHWEIEGENDGEDIIYQTQFNKIEKIFIDMKKNINSKMWSMSYREKATPQMDIPYFNGNYHQWVSFKDLFMEVIHKNPSLSNAQKMQFLKSKVTGEAERLIHHLPISSDNYEVCWELLNHRYQNVRLIFTSHMNTLLGLQNIQQHSLNMIKRLHDVTKECLYAIQNLGVDINTWDPLIVHLLAQKLDSITYAEYIESVKKPRELPILKEFLDFLESKFTTLETSRRKQDSFIQKQGTSSQQPHQNNSLNQRSYFQTKQNLTTPNRNYNNDARVNNMKAFHISRPNTCPLCNANHGLWQCNQFLQLTDEQKLKSVNQLNCCHNCLINHFSKSCYSTKTCRKCQGNHNSLLHDALIKNKMHSATNKKYGSTSNYNSTAKERVSTSTHISRDEVSEILLATALVKVTGSDGVQHTLRALIDQGSQISLINEQAAQLLKLKRKFCQGKVFGVGEKENRCKGMMFIEIQSKYNDFSMSMNVIIMNNLIKNLPNKSFPKPSWDHIQNIDLADPQFYLSQPVDLLLGADVYSKIMMGKILRSNNEDQPIAQQTQLGWLLCGSMEPIYNCNIVIHDTEDLRRFWENEEITNQTEMSTEDHECLQYFLTTTKRLSNGRYEVRLPFIPEKKEELGKTRPLAYAQFKNLEKKLEKNSTLKEEYQKFMKEYFTLNHMIPCSNTIPECYLPHHGVIRAESTTTKLRVVFNASSKSTSGNSLNDIMYRGPNLQQDLQALIIKWRQYEYVYCADIEKMYRQIMVHPEDQNYQKILWRESPTDPIQTFQLTTITYGMKPAPFLAMMCLKQLAADEKLNFPHATKALEENFYMDDYCGGEHSIDKAKQLKDSLITLLQKAGFNLRKWTSNEPSLLENLEPSQRKHQTYEFKQPDSTKTLGLGWNPNKDSFVFENKIIFDSGNKATKRSLLSDVSKLFDPLGWLTPLSTSMKALFQSVWLSNLDWDDLLPEKLNNEWQKMRKDINQINTIEIKRWLGIKENQKIELHGFCDASKRAYACVIYCKIQSENETTITLLAAKAKLVSLNKNVSIPRLELMGAHILSQLMEKLLNCLRDYQVDTFAWTDSMAVLGWIQGQPERWKLFVSNRVRDITKIIPSDKWQYIKTSDNPADCASRGMSAKQLSNHQLWWTGPTILKSFKKQDMPKNIYETNLEIKSSFSKQSNAAILEEKDSNIIINLLHKHSSINKIIRIVAYILRFRTYRKQVQRTYLTLNELRQAKMLIIKTVQQLEFDTDLNYFKKHQKMSPKSKILTLNPFTDNDGILRVGGRLGKAQINLEMKHPIILPRSHRLTTLLIKLAHELTFHSGARHTLGTMRQKYWILSGYMTVKRYIRQCVVCKKQDPVKQYQLMGDLPTSRINPEKTFYHCGVDYTGFIEIKANKGRGIKTTKGYIALFICMVTKAVHLELVSDLTSSGFMAALNRMASRRGAPKHLYSDNGTNFVGANNMLQNEYQNLKEIFNDSFLVEISEMGIEWHFNAPSWPNAGGLWERAVRSLKHHLKRVIGHQKLTYEEYNTILIRIEACINTRPLCALSEDPEDLDVLTPAHFLSAARPGLTIIETEHDARTRWYLTYKIFNDLWTRWKTEYLTQLSARNKWKKSSKNVEIGNLVVIHDEQLPAGKWAMGRVIDVHPGDDGLVRVVTLKTKNGVMKRPVVKLSVLPIESKERDSHDQKYTEPKQEIEQKSKTKRSNFCLATISMALLFFMSSFSPANSQHIQRLPNNQTLYFDPISTMQLSRDKWTLVMYYDLEPYWTALETYFKISNYLEKMCLIIEKQSHCNMIMLQLQHESQEINYYNELLLNQHFDARARRRRRRGLINGIGYLANDLFGVLDNHFAEQYTKDIEKIRQNERHIVNLWKNQTSVIEAEFNIIKRLELTVNKQHKMINRKIYELEDNNSRLQKEFQNMSYIQDFTLCAMAGNNLLNNLKRIQDVLIDTITDIYHGQISVHLLTPVQIKNEMQIIMGQIPKDLTLPINNIESDLQSIYKLLRLKTRVTKSYVIFELKFPLIERENFKVYKLVPIPIQDKDKMISVIPISEYVAVNLKDDSYFTLSFQEINACLQHSEYLLCEINKPIFNLENDKSFCMKENNQKCKLNNSNCTNRWIALNSSPNYLYICCDVYTIKIICDDQVTIQELVGSGIISMDKKCLIKGKEFSLSFPQRQTNNLNYSADIFIPKIDQINHIVNIKIQSDEILDQFDSSMNTSISNLEEQIKSMKNIKPDLVDISSHDIHHYIVIYVLVLAAICVTSIWLYKRCRRGRKISIESRSNLQQKSPRRETTAGVQKSVEEPVYSEVQSRKQSTADRQLSVCEHNVQINSSPKRTSSVKIRVLNKDQNTSPIKKEKCIYNVEDSVISVA